MIPYFLPALSNGFCGFIFVKTILVLFLLQKIGLSLLSGTAQQNLFCFSFAQLTFALANRRKLSC